MYIYIYLYIYICPYIYICIYIYLYVCIYIYRYVYIYIHICVCIYIYIDMGVPQHGRFIMEHPIKMDNLGVPLNLYIYIVTFEYILINMVQCAFVANALQFSQFSICAFGSSYMLDGYPSRFTRIRKQNCIIVYNPIPRSYIFTPPFNETMV